MVPPTPLVLLQSCSFRRNLGPPVLFKLSATLAAELRIKAISRKTIWSSQIYHKKAIPHPLTMFYWKHVNHGCAASTTTVSGWNPNLENPSPSCTVHQHNTCPPPLFLRGRIHFTRAFITGVMYGATSLSGSTLIGLWPERLCHDWLPLKARRHPPPHTHHHHHHQWFLKVCCCWILNSTLLLKIKSNSFICTISSR